MGRETPPQQRGKRRGRPLFVTLDQEADRVLRELSDGPKYMGRTLSMLLHAEKGRIEERARVLAAVQTVLVNPGLTAEIERAIGDEVLTQQRPTPGAPKP